MVPLNPDDDYLGSDPSLWNQVHLEIYRASAGREACTKSQVLSTVMDGFRAMTPTELALHFPKVDVQLESYPVSDA